ncbi:hypothetical protein DY000_02016968 [Brassica cretica]|uniref:Uncharacterized protein n=1 Tax=Brassica cretica TaxID=69181 RepID=A0ABQ7DDL8_BRACR|nr:hypothetical protein DY000_02016968 [Brassica cretica]
MQIRIIFHSVGKVETTDLATIFSATKPLSPQACTPCAPTPCHNRYLRLLYPSSPIIKSKRNLDDLRGKFFIGPS